LRQEVSRFFWHFLVAETLYKFHALPLPGTPLDHLLFKGRDTVERISVT
jgi:hypothetical protein